MPPVNLPLYRELLARVDAPSGSSWGLFANPDLGTLSFLTDDHVRSAAALVRNGLRYNLDLPVGALSVPVVHHRKTPEHLIYSTGVDQRDDYFQDFYMQSSTHLDGLRHVRDHEYGNYGGVSDEQIRSTSALGIGAWADAGIVGRGVLIDIPRHLSRVSRDPLDHDAGEPIPVQLILETLETQLTQRRDGDIVLVRTGWLGRYFEVLSEADRLAVPDKLACAGLEQSHDILEWLWDSRVALLASDNPAVECYPPSSTSPFNPGELANTGVKRGMMHPRLIARLGLALGELWWLDDLAAACANSEVYDFMLVSHPLNTPGGVGSPANAIAIR